MKGAVITMATLWVDLSDGKTQISGTQPTPKSVPVHEISVKDKDSLLLKAEQRGFLKDGQVYIGGIKFLLN